MIFVPVHYSFQGTLSSLAHIIDTSRVPVEGKSSVCLICMKYRIIFLIIIIISLGQILLSYIANTSRTYGQTRAHEPAQTRAHVAVSLFDGSVPAKLAIEINIGGPVSPMFWVFFAYNENVRPNWHANSWEDVLSDDTNSLRHLSRRSSKNCDLQFANTDRQT